MRRTLMTLAIGLMASCTPDLFSWGTPRISEQAASRSVYKIKTFLTLGSADPADKVSVTHQGWHGTAWVVSDEHNRSRLMTAGHVCETGDTWADEDWFGPTGVVLPIRSVVYTLEAADGTVIEGARVILDDDDVDLCLLSVQGDLGVPIPLATEDPPYGGEGWYIGAPMGSWGGGVAGIYKTVFMGRGQIFHDGRDALAFSTAQAQHGASGSPYIYDGRAVAVLTLGHGGFMTISTGVPWNIIKSFLIRASHGVT